MKHRGHRDTEKEKKKHFLFLSLCALCSLCPLCSPFLFAAPVAQDHTRLGTYLDDRGAECPIKTPQDWSRRRAQILDGIQQAMGKLPDRFKLPPLDVKVTGETNADGFHRLTLSFVS